MGRLCKLSQGWSKSLVHNQSIYPSNGELNYVFFKPSKKYCPPRLPSRRPLEFQGDVFFFNHSALSKNQEIKYQCTYEDPISTVPEQSSAFFLQETDIVNYVPMSRTAYHESCQVGPGWSEASRMQDHAYVNHRLAPSCLRKTRFKMLFP